ncbi:acyl-CoA dehydrogenase family protein [Sphingomonas montanisoli]|uniref:Acyl-CoA dehydrogenase n=1 Tax=Sphingomonas montanisoli TaxID=2606412 RepID=A0A5D9CBG6_9SPHN|nr:acyl-CoA dehydrogenase family protein [Sphingomonas montanisoli]TZG28637.1 acyl-CoA dehydrogenase [Sphingomonas montanisoli]
MSDHILTPEQAEIRSAVQKVLADFDDAYWHDCDEAKRFPEEFVKAMADGGWLGIAMPQSVGGAGLGLGEAAAMMQAVTESGAGFTGASAIHLNIFGLMPLIRFGTDEQRARHLPRVLAGEDRVCFGVTEPDSGLDTTSLKTFATKKPGGGWRINGRKMWTSGAQTATKILIIVRTTPKEECAKPTEGLSLFYTDLDRSKVDVRRIPKMGRNAVDTNAVFIDDLDVPDEDLVGEVGKGFRYLLHGLNPERVLFAAESVGLGRAALRKASDYARDRTVFGRPIGQNQGIQHPLAKSWMELEAANLMAFQAARLFDADQECGSFANAAKYLGAEAGFHACETAVLTHGGMGYAREFHVERYFRESMIARIAPVSREMIFSYVAERELGQKKSY